MSEFGPYDTAVAMWSRHFAPDDSDFRSLSFPCGSVDESYSLSEVKSGGGQHSSSPALYAAMLLIVAELVVIVGGRGKCLLCGFRVINTFYLDERAVWVCVSLSSLVRQVLAFYVYCSFIC